MVGRRLILLLWGNIIRTYSKDKGTMVSGIQFLVVIVKLKEAALVFRKG